MIHTTVCTSLTQAKSRLLDFTEPNGDPFAQDWVICPHSESVKWVKDLIATEREICAQISCFSSSYWVSELQSKIWPSLPLVPSINRLTWAMLEATTRLGKGLAQDLSHLHELSQIFGVSTVDESDPLAQRRARRRGKALASKRLLAAQRFAKIFRRLLLTRPHWLQAWDELNKEECAQDETFWPLLWSELADVLGPLHPRVTKVNQNRPALWSDWLELLCRKAADPQTGLSQHVRRLIFFGHHRYDAQSLALARACAQTTQVYFITIDPLTYGRFEQSTQEESERAVPLMSSYGSGFTAYRSLSDEHLNGSNLRPIPPFPITPPPVQQKETLATLLQNEQNEQPATLLSLFQTALTQAKPRPEAPLPCLPELKHPQEDFSLRFHTSYSDQRQVEDLYQTIRAALRRDPQLRPRDILVLCPDIERFAPLILAVFNGDLSAVSPIEASKTKPMINQQSLNVLEASHTETSRRLGAELARPNGQNPYAVLLKQVLKLSKSRLYRHDVFQCLKHPLVSAKFKLSLSDIIKLEQWIRLSGIRWGLDADHRVACGLNEEAQHSWEFGLDRLLMGYLVGEEHYRGYSELYDGVAAIPLNGEDSEKLLSKFCDFFFTLKNMLPKLASAHTPAVWCELLIDVLRKLCVAHTLEDKALRQDVESDLRRALKRQAPSQQNMTNKAMGLLIEHGIGQQKMVVGAGRDHVRFYSLDQAYAVPAKMLCFLNLSEGQFPFRAKQDRLDPTLAYPLPNDIDPIQEQFANLLASILAAQEQIHFFYTGQKANGETRLPAPILQAIQEELSARFTYGGKAADLLVEALTIQHPLHSFSPRNFIASEAGEAGEMTLSHEPIWLKGAKAWQEAMRNPRLVPPFSARTLAIASRGVSRPKLDTLKQLLKNPSEFFLKRGVGMSLLKDEELTKERELLELDSLQSWFLKDRTFKLLQAMDPSIELKSDQANPVNPDLDLSISSPLTEENFQHIVNIVRAEGLLPIGKMGEVSFEQALDEVKSLYERFSQAKSGESRQALSLNLKLPSGRPLHIEGDMYYGNQLVFATPSRHMGGKEEQYPKGERLIEPWLYHVALSAADPKFEGTTLVAKDGQFDKFPKLAQAEAAQLLETWIDLMEEGSLKPLRFEPELSWKWLKYASEHELEPESIEAFAELTKQWNKADNLYVLQTYDGEAPWRDKQAQIDISEPNIDPSLDLKTEPKSNSMGIHPDFIQQSEIVFGPLSTSLMGEES